MSSIWWGCWDSAKLLPKTKNTKMEWRWKSSSFCSENMGRPVLWLTQHWEICKTSVL